MKKVDFRIMAFPEGFNSFNKSVMGIRHAFGYKKFSLLQTMILVKKPLPISLGVVDMPFAEKAQKIMDEYGIKTEFVECNYEL